LEIAQQTSTDPATEDRGSTEGAKPWERFRSKSGNDVSSDNKASFQQPKPISSKSLPTIQKPTTLIQSGAVSSQKPGRPPRPAMAPKTQ